jgi:hypothetical protein
MEVKEINPLRQNRKEIVSSWDSKKKSLPKKYIRQKDRVKLRVKLRFWWFSWVSPCLSFFSSVPLHYCYIYIHWSYLSTRTVIRLEPCALDAEFQHFILSFNKNFITLQIPLKQTGVKGWKEGQRPWIYGILYWVFLMVVHKEKFPALCKALSLTHFWGTLCVRYLLYWSINYTKCKRQTLFYQFYKTGE